MVCCSLPLTSFLRSSTRNTSSQKTVCARVKSRDSLICFQNAFFAQAAFTCCAGLLTSGIIPSIRHCVQNLMTADMVILPAAATVYIQAAEIRIADVCGVDMTPTNQYRWHPSHLAGSVSLSWRRGSGIGFISNVAAMLDWL